MKNAIPVVTAAAIALLGLSTPALAGGKHAHKHNKAEASAIKAVIENGYVRGAHIEGSASLMREAFHPDFVMVVNGDEGLRKISLDEWTGRVKPRAGDAPPPKVKSDIRVLDIDGNAAVARVKVWRDGKLMFTDYMSLYKTEGRWRIVAKTFQSHK